MIKFRCPHCQQKLGVPDNYAGHRIRCSKCGQPGMVPAAAEPAPLPEAMPVHPVKTAVTAQPHPQPEPQPQPQIVELDTLALMPELPQDEDDEAARREAAIRQARQDQQSRQTKAEKTRSSAPKKTNNKESGFPLLERIPDILRLPLGLAAGVAAAGAVIWLWMLCARSSESALCFAAVFVPIAAALALRFFTIERTLLVGLLAVLIGGFGIAAGKAVIARSVVVPWFHQQADKVILADLKTILADPDAQLPPNQSAKFIVRDGDFMTCIALISMVDDGRADPAEANTRAVKILRASNKLNIVDFFDSITSVGSVSASMVTDPFADDELVNEAYGRIGEWNEQEISLQMARKYYPAFASLTEQATLQRTLEDPKQTYQLAFLNTLGVLDLVWVMLGLGLGYILAVFD